MAIKVIVELQVKPGRRAELSGLLDGRVANQGSSLFASGSGMSSARSECPRTVADE